MNSDRKALKDQHPFPQNISKGTWQAAGPPMPQQPGTKCLPQPQGGRPAAANPARVIAAEQQGHGLRSAPGIGCQPVWVAQRAQIAMARR